MKQIYFLQLARFYNTLDRRSRSDYFLENTTRDQIIMNETIKNEISRANSFLYSNIFCLNNNPAQVDKEFNKLQMFIQAQKSSLRKELVGLLPPILCHFYIEMLKGRDWKPAIEFLKKYSSILGTVEPSAPNQFTKVNGTMEETAANVILITYAQDQENPDMTPFRQLVTTLSGITCIQDIESDIQAANFRSCKYRIRMSDRTLLALRRYLSKDAHVLILQVLQIWIDIDTTDDKSSEAEEETATDVALLHHSNSSLNGFSSNLDDINETDISKFTNLLASPKPAKREEQTRDEDFPSLKIHASTEIDSIRQSRASMLDETKAFAKTRLQNLKAVNEKVNAHQIPMQVFSIHNANDMICTANLDANNCHFACGLEDSSVMLWSGDNSLQTGKKPYGKSLTKQCEWHVTSLNELEDDMSSEEDDELTETRAKRLRQLRKAHERERFMGKRCQQNVL